MGETNTLILAPPVPLCKRGQDEPAITRLSRRRPTARDMHLTSPATTAAAGRAHKRVRWRVPPGKKRPGVLDALRAELVRALEHRQGSVWLRVRTAAPIAGYPIARALDRLRALRRDGAESVLAMIVALIYLADVRTGFIGKPRPERGPWQRYALPDLAQLAYGAQTEADVRRARRALDVLIGLGWAFPTRQVRRHVGTGGAEAFVSEPAVRRINFGRLCEMTGTTWLLKRDRAHADRTKGDGLASLQQARQRRDAAPLSRGADSGGPPAARATPPPTGDPPRQPVAPDTALRHINDILRALRS